MGRLLLLLTALATTAVSPRAVTAQHVFDATVRQVAGSNVYIDRGASDGVAAGDTLVVLRGPDGPVLGTLVVVAATADRSVLAFAGAVFPVTRGQVLTVRSPGGAVPAATPGDTGPGRPGARPAEPARPARPRAYGRIGAELSHDRSVTTFGGSASNDVSREFTSPALRLDLTVPDVGAGIRFRTGMRVSYRNAGPTPLAPESSVRVYSAYLEKEFGTAPFRVTLGRFASPAESYSGYWDGLLLRAGGRNHGGGVIVGFEPDRWNERPSLEVPKATVFLETRHRGAGWRWDGEASAHAVRPTDSLPDHTFAGFSQHLGVGAFRLSQDLQVDEDPVAGGWRVSRIQLRGDVVLSPGWLVRASAARRESYLPWYLEDLFAPRHERVGLGLAYHGSGGSLGVDGYGTRRIGATDGRAASASFSLARLPRLDGVGLAGMASYWKDDITRTVTAAPSFVIGRGDVRGRLGYRLHRWEAAQEVRLTHGGEAGVDVMLPSGLRGSLRVFAQRGGGLRRESVRFSLVRVF